MSNAFTAASPDPIRVSVVTFPETAVSTVTGIYDVMNASRVMTKPAPDADAAKPFHVEIVGETPGALLLVSGVSIHVQRCIDEIEATDIVIVPSVILPEHGWVTDRYPRLVAWLSQMHARGAVLCSACSGLFLLGETRLFDGKHATVHFIYTRDFQAVFPAVPIHPERVLVISGRREELVSSGAATAWHDLVLYLIARYAGSTSAQAVARFFALQWHQDGLTPYMVFEGRRDHGDAAIQRAQDWLHTHFSVARPVEEMVKRSSLGERTFKRRFTQGTGLSPIAYVQRLRVEEAKRRLERTNDSIDDISWKVGYEEPAFFRRLFKRTAGLAPGAYRKRFQMPSFATPAQTKV